MFPVPNATDKTATMMGGWILSIPETSTNKDLSWELLTIMLEPDVLSPMLARSLSSNSEADRRRALCSAEHNHTILQRNDIYDPSRTQQTQYTRISADS